MSKACMILSATTLLLLTVSCAPWNTEKADIEVNVEPFYRWQGPQVNVGDFSNQLQTKRAPELVQTARVMHSNIDRLTPEQLYVVAVRLYELGERDRSLYWFYQAQYRARFYDCSVNKTHNDTRAISSKAAVLARAYRHFYVRVEPYFSGYASCDYNRWLSVIDQVKRDNRTPPALNTIFPDIPFKTTQFEQCNAEITNNISLLERQIVLKQQSSPNGPQVIDPICKQPE